MPEPAKPTETANGASIHPSLGIAQLTHSAPASATPVVAIDELLVRMRGRDRDAAADFLKRYGSRIRRRIHGKLGPAIRRLFDSLEILSTLGRRLDVYVMSGRLQATNEDQLWSLLFKMADNALVDKARIFSRLQETESADSDFAQQLGVRLREAEAEKDAGVELEIENCIRALTDQTDQRILSLWLTGQSHAEIAEHLNISHTAVRWRWGKIKAYLKERFYSERL